MIMMTTMMVIMMMIRPTLQGDSDDDDDDDDDNDGYNDYECQQATNHKHSPIRGLHRPHVGGQNKRKFVYKVCIKMAGNSHRRKISLFLSTNMTAMTSQANHQFGLLLLRRDSKHNNCLFLQDTKYALGSVRLCS